MRRKRLCPFVAASASLAMLGATGWADFPHVAQLPAQPDLPDALLKFDGKRVGSEEEWHQQRRPELKALFQHYMYGQPPAAPEKVTSTIERVDRQFFGGKATKKEVTIVFGPPEVPPIHLLLVSPNARKRPAPAFVGMNFCGNHAVVKDPSVPLPTAWIYSNYPGVVKNRATEAGRGTQVDVWALEQSIERGYAVATFYSGDIDPDRPEAREGIQPHFTRLGLVKESPHAWGTIAAWAWGIHRAVDYLRTDPDIDRNRIAVVGHSRLGKTALLAAAFDDRIALAIPH